MGDPELLSMLATEAERRTPTIITGLEELAASGEKDSARIEELRVEAHGLKGAALVVGQDRLADLARELEEFLAGCVETGRDPARLRRHAGRRGQRLHRGRPGRRGGSRRALLGRRIARGPQGLDAGTRAQSAAWWRANEIAPITIAPITSHAGISQLPISATRSEGRRYAGAISATMHARKTTIARTPITGAATSVRAGASTLSSRDAPDVRVEHRDERDDHQRAVERAEQRPGEGLLCSRSSGSRSMRIESTPDGTLAPPRAGSSAGQSSGLIIRRSVVRVHPGPLESPRYGAVSVCAALQLGPNMAPRNGR